MTLQLHDDELPVHVGNPSHDHTTQQIEVEHLLIQVP